MLGGKNSNGISTTKEESRLYWTYQCLSSFYPYFLHEFFKMELMVGIKCSRFDITQIPDVYDSCK